MPTIDDYDDLADFQPAKRPAPAFAPAVDKIRERDGARAAAEVEAAASADDRGAPQGNKNAANKHRVRGFWTDERERYSLLATPGNAYVKRGWRLSNGFVASYNGALVAHTSTGIGGTAAHAVILPNGRRFTYRSAKAAFDFVERNV